MSFSHSSYSKKTCAKWSASILVHSRASGLAIEVSGQNPVFTDEDSEGHCTVDVSALHAKHLPRILNFGDVLKSLKSTLEGGWEFAAPCGESYGLTNPVFNRQGDLIVQLCDFKPSSTRPHMPPSLSYCTWGCSQIIKFADVLYHKCPAETVKVHASLGTHSHSITTSKVIAPVTQNGHAKAIICKSPPLS